MFYIESLIQTTPEYTLPENVAKIGRAVSEPEGEQKINRKENNNRTPLLREGSDNKINFIIHALKFTLEIHPPIKIAPSY